MSQFLRGFFAGSGITARNVIYCYVTYGEYNAVRAVSLGYRCTGGDFLNISYVKADPGGNTTILVLDAVPASRRAAVAGAILACPDLAAEQVGYIRFPAGAENGVRIDMMGGEFCGNAARSAAAYALSLSGREKGRYDVSCSGYEGLLTTVVERTGNRTYKVCIDMPLPKSITALRIPVDGKLERFFRVDLPGITHFVRVLDGSGETDKEAHWRAVKEYTANGRFDAFGLILFNRETRFMIPAVYVSGTDTLYWENSCASGTAALAAVLACAAGTGTALRVNQPGGALLASVRLKGGRPAALRLGGTLTLSEKGQREI